MFRHNEKIIAFHLLEFSIFETLTITDLNYSTYSNTVGIHSPKNVQTTPPLS